MLTIANAKAYMEKFLVGSGAEIVNAWEKSVDGIPTVTVEFITRDKRQEFADVWMEGGKIYGEF